ncbi:aminoglycoside phosphotransferase [Nonomuraea candida]|uniref:aminoglycoside phosphotransferase n=1 Tax=Nonomuraea candida TaxID=359159 RepID=UPI0012FBA1C0|nr:aminoglycoside phosphotransferase [Nonomuraea candida]
MSLIGEAVFGWHDRTIGSASATERCRFWLRATAEQRDWAHGEAWTGNRDAATIKGVPKPELIARTDWDEPPVSIYAELLTYISDAPCSSSPELTEPLTLASSWWVGLRAAMDVLAEHPTARGEHDPWALVRRVEVFYGQPLNMPKAPALRTEHTDLHWSNLTCPRLWLLDWEHWGMAPAGYGAAVLYLHSFMVPDTAAHVRTVFADVLDTPTGRLAQLSAAAHILDRADRSDDYATLADPVRAHAARLLQLAGRH